MPKLTLPPPLRGPIHGAAHVEVDGATVRACIQAADARFPGFAAQILTPDGGVHRFVRLFLNGASLFSSELDRPVSPKDEIAVLAAIAGG